MIGKAKTLVLCLNAFYLLILNSCIVTDLVSDPLDYNAGHRQGLQADRIEPLVVENINTLSVGLRRGLVRLQAVGRGMAARKLLTLVIPRQHGKLLLGKKLRGFGEGYFNGFGGKVEAGETIEEAALRELHEEAGITATAMTKCGILTFVFDDKPVPWEVHVFDVTEFEGTPTTTDEMDPTWFLPEQIPYDQMWADDVHWYPLFLRGRQFRGTFHFRDTHSLVEHQLEEVDSL